MPAVPVLSTDWDVSLWGSRRAFTEHVEKLAELVSQRTDGAFTLNLSYGGLSKNRENLDGISKGAFEMAQFCAGYHPDKNPSITVMELPFLGIGNLEEERRISQALYDHPAVKQDMDRWNATLLMPSPLPQYNIIGTDEPPLILVDFLGLSVRATGGISAAMKTLEAIPRSLSATEVPDALRDGLVKAVAFAPHAHMSFGTLPNAKWWTTNLNPGTVNCPVVVNSDALAALPEDHRAALLESIDDALDHYIRYYETETMRAWGPTLKALGIEQITYSDREIEDFIDAVAQPAAQAWIRENTQRGLPAAELYEFVTDMVAN
ncbi:MAG: C4-dicarboxylate ABC transporter substrate-binding protein [Pseudomonadota bacterium]